jgi:hypothetical protein
MEKAKIHILDDKGKKREDKTIDVMFNPTEYSNAINVKWKGGEGEIPEFLGSNFGNLVITLFFDTYEKGADVREAGIKRIVELGVPSVEGEEWKTPPLCLFSWGKFNFKGVIEKVEPNFTMFLSDGTPVRAKVTITMKPVLSAQDMLKMQGVEACRKVRTVIEGDRLDIIAAEELKDSSLWRKIAEANNIADPLNFPRPEDIGRVIIIPD